MEADNPNGQEPEFQHSQTPNKKKSRKRIIALASACIAVLILAASVICFNLFKEETNVLLNKDVVVYDKDKSSFEILESGENYVVVSSTDGLNEGKILNAGVSDATPNGLLCRINSVEKSDNGFRLQTQPAALTEAIDKCDIQAVIQFNEDGTYAVEENNLPENSPFRIQQAFANGAPDNLFYYSDRGLTASAGNRIEVSLSINYGEIKMRLVDHLYAGVSQKFEIGSMEETVFDKPIGRFTIFVGSLMLVFTNDLKATLATDVSLSDLECVTELSLDKVAGFEYSTKNGLSLVLEDNSKVPSISFNPQDEKFRAGFQTSLTATLSSYLYGYAGPDLSIGLQSGTGLLLQFIPNGESSEGAIEIPGVAEKLRGKITEKVTVPISGKFQLSIPFNPFDTKRDPIEIADKTLFDTGDAITLLDIDLAFGKVSGTKISGTHVETEWFSFDVPENWKDTFSFEETEESFINGRTDKVWILSSGISTELEGGEQAGELLFTTVAGNGYTPPYDNKYQSIEGFWYESYEGTIKKVDDFGANSICVVYPSKIGGFYRFRPSAGLEPVDPIELPSNQQVLDAQYILSTFKLK